MTLIVDAAPLVALGDVRDPRQRIVQTLLQVEAGPLVLPAPITAEVDYLVRQRGGARAGRRFLEDLAAGRFSVESLTVAEHQLALEIHERYADLNLGLADLSVLVLAHRYDTHRLLTFDERDFRAVRAMDGGAFTLLPSDLP